MKPTLFSLLFVLLFACEEKPATTAPPTQTTSAEEGAPEVQSGKFSVDLKVSGSQEVHQMENAPKPAAVQAQLSDAIHATEAFAKDGPRKLKGLVTYDVQPLPNDGGWDVVLLGSLNSPQANFNAGVNLQSSDEAWKGRTISEMVDGAVAEFSKRIGAQARVIGGDGALLLKIMETPEEPESARLMAIQEVRERRLAEYIEPVRKYLAPEHGVKLRLAAAATLVSLGDQKSRSDIIKVAEDFSRDRNPQYVPILHILGDLGGPEVVSYLEAVAEAHAAPAVRTVAQEALEKARKVQVAP